MEILLQLAPLAIIFGAIGFQILLILSGHVVQTKQSSAIHRLRKKAGYTHKSYSSVIKIHSNYRFTINQQPTRAYSCLKATTVLKTDLSSSFSISKETPLSEMQKDFGSNDILTYDSYFDEKMLIKGENENYMIGLLSKPLRDEILYLENCVDTLEITHNLISASVKEEFDPNKTIQNIELCIRHLSRIAGMLDIASAKPVTEMLAQNSYTEDAEAIAYNSFIRLLNNYPHDAATKETIEKVFQVSSTRLKVKAATYLGVKGLEYLNDVLTQKNLLNTEDILLAIETLRNARYKKSINTLKELYIQTSEINIKTLILKSLTEFSSDTVSDFLTQQIQEEKDTKLFQEILEALEKCGTVKAIETLYKISQIRVNPVIKTKLKNTIEFIQSRLGLTDTGLVSLSSEDTQSGAVSVENDDEKGGLSV